jgi:hypothetical protein
MEATGGQPPDQITEFQLKLKQVQKDLLSQVIYLDQSSGKLSLVINREVYFSDTTETRSWKSPILGLVLNSDYLFYPVLEFYSPNGLAGISFNLTSTNSSESIRELGDAYLDYRQISKFGKELLKRFTLIEIYENIELILDILVRLITKSSVLVTEYSSLDYFGVSITLDQRKEKTELHLELDSRIRKEIGSKMPTLNSNSWITCQIS